jgi:hypothetical protein
LAKIAIERSIRVSWQGVTRSSTARRAEALGCHDEALLRGLIQATKVAFVTIAGASAVRHGPPGALPLEKIITVIL